MVEVRDDERGCLNRDTDLPRKGGLFKKRGKKERCRTKRWRHKRKHLRAWMLSIHKAGEDLSAACVSKQCS